MKVGYAMIRNSTDPIEDQIMSLKKVGCKHIYKDVILNKDTGLTALRDLLENLSDENIVVIESLNIIAPNMEAPLGFFEILIDKKCSLELTSKDKIYANEELKLLSLMWTDLLECRARMKSRRWRKALYDKKAKE